jgi:hypothetical protein
MADKSWMLNPKAIRHANECIQHIKDLEGVRLKLSQPDFLSQLHSYVDSIRSPELGESYARLLSMAGVGNVMSSIEAEPAQAVVAEPVAVGQNSMPSTSDEVIQLGGKNYPKFRNGRKFQGLYRGIPRYR